MRKRRTREHIIADLSVNFVERQILLCGWAVERFQKDYGLDLVMTTYAADGQFENGSVYLQVKATDHLRVHRPSRSLLCRLSAADIEAWRNEATPVILILYDSIRERAYWLYVQAYLGKARQFRLSEGGDGITVRISERNRLNSSAIRQFARYRDRVLAQQTGVIRHET